LWGVLQHGRMCTMMFLHVCAIELKEFIINIFLLIIMKSKQTNLP
jgi:hypothetical protein